MAAALLPPLTHVALTGASGFVGGRFAAMVAGSPDLRLHVISRRRAADGTAAVALDDALALRTRLAGCRAVLHCAFDTHNLGKNLEIARTLAACCIATGARLVHLSSAAVYEPFPDADVDESSRTDRPSSAYAETKREVEQFLSSRVADGLDLVILQPTIIYGPFGGAWTDGPIRELLTGDVYLPLDGQGLCNAVFVDDVCQAMLRAIDASVTSGERYLISGATPVTWLQFFEAYARMLNTGTLRTLPPADAAAGGSVRSVPVTARPTARAALKRRIAMLIGARTRLQVLRVWARARTMLRGRTSHVPQGSKLALYSVRCRVSIAKATAQLRYAPEFSLQTGMQATAPYVRRTYGNGGSPPARSLRKIPDQDAGIADLPGTTTADHCR